MSKSSIILLFLILLIFLVLFNYTNIKTEYVPNSPDEAQTRFFAHHLINTGNLKWESELNIKNNLSIFTLRNLADLGDNVYAPKKPLFYILNVAIFTLFSRTEFIAPFFGLFGIIVFFLVFSKLFDKRVGLVSTILIGISPVYMLYSNFHWECVPALVLVFLSYYTFLRFVESKKIAYIILTCLLINSGIFLKPVNAPLIMSFFVMLLLLYRKNFNLKTATIAGVTLLVLSVPYLFLNKIVYGGFFSIPEIMRGLAYKESIDYNLVPMDFNVYTISFLNYVILSKIVFLLAILGIMYIYMRGSVHQKRFAISALIYCLFIFIFYGARETTYGFGTMSLATCMNRYFLPISVISYLFAGVFMCRVYSHLKETKLRGLLIPMLASLIIISSLCMNFAGIGGIEDRSTMMQKWSERQEVIKQLPNDSIFLVSESDKYIAPLRKVAVIYTPESPKIKERPAAALIYEVLNVESEVKPLIIKLVNNEGDVYIVHDRNILPLIHKLKQDNRFKFKKVETWLSRIELKDIA